MTLSIFFTLAIACFVGNILAEYLRPLVARLVQWAKARVRR
jgi:hypothetical protein